MKTQAGQGAANTATEGEQISDIRRELQEARFQNNLLQAQLKSLTPNNDVGPYVDSNDVMLSPSLQRPSQLLVQWNHRNIQPPVLPGRDSPADNQFNHGHRSARSLLMSLETRT